MSFICPCMLIYLCVNLTFSLFRLKGDAYVFALHQLLPSQRSAVEGIGSCCLFRGKQVDLLLGHGHLEMKAVNMCSHISSNPTHLKRPCSLKMMRILYLRVKKKKEKKKELLTGQLFILWKKRVCALIENWAHNLSTPQCEPLANTNIKKKKTYYCLLPLLMCRKCCLETYQ